MHSNKKNLNNYYIIGVMVAAVLVAVIVICVLKGHITVPEPEPLNGIVMQDGSMLLIGQQYSIGVISVSCDPSEYARNASYHVLDGFDALVLQGIDENVKDSVREIVANHSLEHLIVPKGLDDAFIQELSVISPYTQVTKVSQRKSLVMGDLVLKAHSNGSSLAFVLSHGVDSILYSTGENAFSEPVSMAVIPSGCVDTSWLSSNSTIYYGGDDGLVLAAAAVSTPIDDISVEFYSDGYGKLLMNSY